MKYPIRPAFVGFNGDNVWLEPVEDDHPLAVARPELFTDTPPPGVEAPKPKRSRPRKTTPAATTREPKSDD